MSSEDLKSLIVTDPDLLDEGIDVSGLRTQTDTDPRLLASIADFPGISYDPTEFSYLSDLNELFAYGLPEGDTSGTVTPPVITTPVVDTGGGGQAITPTTSITDGTNINTPGGLTQSGTFGGQPTFTTTPGTTVDDITGDITNPDGSYGGNIVDEVALTGGAISPTTPPIDPTGRLPQTSASRFAATGTLSDPREKQDFITEEDAADPGFLDKIGLGQFNLGEALVKTAINTAIGKPVTFLLDFLKNNLPPQDPRQTELNKLYDVQDGTIQSGLMKGYNPVSGGFPGISEPTFGLQEAYQDRIDTIENTLADKYNMTAAEIADVKAGTYAGDVDTELFDRLNQLETDKAKEKARLDLFSGDIQETGDASIAEQLYDADRLGISGDIGVEGEDEGRFSDKAGTPSVSSVNEADVEAGLGTESISDFIDDFEVSGEAAPPTGDTASDSFFDALDRASGKDDKPTGPPSTGFKAPTQQGQSPRGSTTGGGGGQDSGGSKGCVIATHAVNSGAFTKDTKREAVRWCVKNLHRTWWGEAIRRGYRYYGQKAIEEGKAKNHYQEFKDYVAFGTGKRRTLKTSWTFVYRTVQFFIRGLFNAK